MIATFTDLQLISSSKRILARIESCSHDTTSGLARLYVNGIWFVLGLLGEENSARNNNHNFIQIA